MKAFFSLLLTFGAIFVCNFTTAAAYDDSQTTALYPYVIFEPALESIDNLYRAILGLYRSCVIAIRKYFSEKLQEIRNGNPPPTNNVAFGELYKFKIWRDQNNHYTGTLQEMIFYMQREVNEAESNIQIIIKYFSGLADGTIPPPDELPPRVVQLIITIWVELQDSTNKLIYDVDVFRSYVKAKIDSLKNRYGEGTFELHAGMKIIYHEIETRSLHWVKIVGPVFRKALALPEASYYIVSLEMFYAEWPNLFLLPPEATVVEILIQCRAVANTVHNAAQAYFFLSVSMRIKADTWPYLNLIFQDSANIKRFADRGFTRIESYIRSSLNRIQEEIQAENYDQADLEMQNVRKQVESDVKVIIDFTETSYRRIYDALFAALFDTYATDLRYTDACQNLLWYLVDQGFAISWPENEFAPINERIQIVSLSDTNYPEVITHYSKSNFRSIANFNDAGNDSRYLQMALNAYHLILHENLLLDIISIYQSLLNNLKNSLPQNNASKVILVNLREDAILFAQGFQYLRLYVSQSGLLIDWVSVETVEDYMILLMKLDLDVLHRIDILCYRALSTFQRALDYLYWVNSNLPPPTEVTPQEQVPAQDTNITPREFTDVPIVQNPVVDNAYPGYVFRIQAPPSFWMARRLLNRHGKLPYYFKPTAGTFTTPAIVPATGAVEILPPNGVELPATVPQITSTQGTGTPRGISNDINVGKKRPTLQPSAYRPTQYPVTTGNEIMPEIVAEVPPTVELTPVEEIPISSPQLYVPSGRFLNLWPFGRRIRLLPRKYQPTISPPLDTNITDVVPEGNVINTQEPILPADNYAMNPSQTGFSTPRSLNQGFFGKREGFPTSSPQMFTSPPAVTNPLENYEGNGQNNVDVAVPTGEFTSQPTVILPSAGGMNGVHFGKREDMPRSLQQPSTYSPSVIPGQIPVDNTNGIPGQEWVPGTNNVNGIPMEDNGLPVANQFNSIPGGQLETNVIPTVNEYNSVPEGQFVEPLVENTNGIPEQQYIAPAVNDFIPTNEGEFVQPVTNNMNTVPNTGVTAENPNFMTDDELWNTETPAEEFVPFQHGNTPPNQEEIAAALNLLSSIYEPLDTNNDGTTDILIINPAEVNPSLFGGNGTPQGVNGGATILLDQTTEGYQMSNSSLEGNGYFDQSGILHGGTISGTQHEEAVIDSNTTGLVDFQSDGVIDMAVENATNQIVNEDSNYIVLGDLDPNDGRITNTIIRTSLTTEEETSMTTYVLGQDEQPPLQNTQQ